MKQTLFVLLLLLSGIWFNHATARITMRSASQLEVTAEYDANLNASMRKQLADFKRKMGQSVVRQIGTVTSRMTAGRPESPLSNFLADQLLEEARALSMTNVDLSVINIGGIRAALNKGILTEEAIFRVVPFEDELVLLKIKGKHVMSLFQQIARVGGEGLSGARLTCRNGVVQQATVGGEPIDENKTYVLATFDYLARGNGGLSALLKADETTNLGCKVRDCYIRQIEKLTAAGKLVQASLDGRITVLP